MPDRALTSGHILVPARVLTQRVVAGILGLDTTGSVPVHVHMNLGQVRLILPTRCPMLRTPDGRARSGSSHFSACDPSARSR